METSPERSAEQVPAPARLWLFVCWVPVVVCGVFTAALWAAGPEYVSKLGPVPDSTVFWVFAPLSVFTHLSAAHLVANVAGWVLACTAARRSGLEVRWFALTAVCGAAAGVVCHVITGSGHLHGASAAVLAVAVLCVACAKGTGWYRAGLVLVVFFGLLGGEGISPSAHVGGVAVGVVSAAAYFLVGRRQAHLVKSGTSGLRVGRSEA